MDLVDHALARLREYRLTLDPMQTIDPVGGLSANDLDVILQWAADQTPSAGPEASSRLPYIVRLGLRAAAFAAIIAAMVIAWHYIGR